MAEALLRPMLAAGTEVGSVGTHALLGHPADENVLELLASRGIDASAHRARQASTELLRGADLVLAMESHHLREVNEIDATVRGKAFLVGHWSDKREIADPFQQGREAFEQTLSELDLMLPAWLAKLN